MVGKPVGLGVREGLCSEAVGACGMYEVDGWNGYEVDDWTGMCFRRKDGVAGAEQILGDGGV